MKKSVISLDKKGQFPLPEELESPKKLKEKQKALQISIEEGTAASVSGSAGASYITPFALAINASPIHIGYLSSFSGLLSPIAQIFGSKLMKKYSRKRIVMLYVLLQALMWIPISIIGFLAWKGMFGSYLIYALLVTYSLTVIFGGIANPAWFSWMGDLVPPEEKGKYFAKRNRATGAVGLAAALIIAFALDALKTKGLALAGFAAIFFFAFLFRFISYVLFKKQFSPKFRQKAHDYFSFTSFIKRFDNYGKFTMYDGLFNLSLMIASPFFAVYMLKNLGFSYVTFMLVSLSGTVFYLLFTPLAGKFSDKFGNKKLLGIANILFAVTPLLWIFIKSPIYLILIPQFISGIANAAWIIGETNFIYDSVSPRHRGICISYSSLVIGIGIFIGSLAGGLILNYFPTSGVNPFFIAFGVSAVLRLASGIIFLPKIKEERRVKRLPAMHLDVVHPFRTVQSEVGWFKHVFR